MFFSLFFALVGMYLLFVMDISLPLQYIKLCIYTPLSILYQIHLCFLLDRNTYHSRRIEVLACFLTAVLEV